MYRKTIRKAGRRLPHTTLIEGAVPVVKAIRDCGLLPYPGVIAPKGKSPQLRIKLTREPHRYTVSVAAQGSQELHIYGPVNKDALLLKLQTEFGADKVVFKDATGN